MSSDHPQSGTEPVAPKGASDSAVGGDTVPALHGPKGFGVRIYGALTGLAAIAGGAVSVRHIWLQSLPADQVPACGPGLNYMLDVFPLQSVIQEVLAGSGECAEMDWSFLGLSLPAWSLVVFSGLLLVALVQLFRPLSRS